MTPSIVKLDSAIRVQPLFASGKFAQGQDTLYANLTHTSTGTRYATRRGVSIIRIGADGIVQAISPGTDTISVTHNARVVRIPVTVASNFSQATYRTNQITFTPIAAVPENAAPFGLQATATSGEPVRFQVVSGPAIIRNGVLSVTGPGLVTVTASQAGNAYYQAAPNVSQSFHVTVVAGVKDGVATRVRMFPNPTKGQVTVEMPSYEWQTIRVRNIQGQLVLIAPKQKPQQTSITMNVKLLAPGMYFLEVDGKVEDIHLRLIKQ